MSYLRWGVQDTEIVATDLSNTVDVAEVKRIVAEGEVKSGPNSDGQLLLRGPSHVPADRMDRNPGRHE